jgi:predicted permease
MQDVSVFNIIVPIFLVIGIGYLAVRTELIPRSVIPGMGRFVLYFCLPALIFTTLISTDILAAMTPYYLIAYGVGSLLAYLIGFAFSKGALKATTSEASLNGLGMSLSNSAFVGYPVLLQVFGALPAAAFTMTLLVENLLIMPLALMVLELSRALSEGGNTREVIRRFVQRLITQPILLAIVCGTLYSVSGFSLPGAVSGGLDFLANASAGVALFVIGGSLVGISVKGEIWKISWVTVGKLCIHPLLVAFMVFLLPPFDRQLQVIAILAASIPMLSIYPVIAGNYLDPSRYAATLVVATLASFFTLSVVLALLF